jgi:prephenate dehydratase
MVHATQCIIFRFTLPDTPGILLRLANKLRAADISLLALWARSNQDNTSTMRCIAERDAQFRDFSLSAELSAEEEVAIHVHSAEDGGEFIRVLEKVASVNVNITAIEAVSLSGQMGWVIWTDEEQIESLLTQLNASS